MDAALGFILIILPIILALVLLVFLKKAADVTGVIVWVVTLIIAIVVFQTDIGIALTASLAGIVKSFPISLMVATSILMMTYMQETGALQRLIVFFKTLGGGSRPMQILMISFGLGLFLVGIGATPVSMLPPVMLALGFSPMVAVALPSIGYDPLTTFALLGVPAVVFAGEYSAWATEITLQQAGAVFAWFMPLVSMGIAISMLWIAGGRKLLLSRDGLVLASICGLTAGAIAIICNVLLPLTTLTNVFAGAAVLLVLFIFNRIRGKPILDRGTLDEKDIQVEEGMSIYRASIPWVVLVILSLVTNMIPQIFQLLFVDLALPVQIGAYPGIIKTRFLWQAYTLMLISTILSIPFLKTDRDVLKRTITSFKKRAPRPVLAAAIFFAMAEVMNFSGWVVDTGGIWLNPTNLTNGLDPTNNMIYLLASLTAGLGLLYPLLAPFMGLLGGFISGSETSAIAMFTKYHVETSNLIGASSIHVAASNGIGGGLASVLSPAKIQNAAAVIDEIGIEGEVIRYGLVVAVLMTLVTAMMTLLWAFPLSLLTLSIVAGLAIVVIIIGGIIYWVKQPADADSTISHQS
ncbi:MAG: L-lactate permease [Candidatus Thorarchaeota archaeon AB_25]|nr:MAG: L-lactate permease [Candidatus Thorarchaeota archaeon AB_25]